MWCALSVVFVALRGVQWDEQLEMAQIIVGKVVYPDGHPLTICAKNALNLQIYATSGVLWLSDSIWLTCAFRNLLFMMMTVLPIYYMAAKLSGRSSVGHLAVLVLLIGMHEPFFGNYRLWTWPGFHSTGQVGRGYALLLLTFLCTKQWRTGAFFLGLMPCFHIGQMPPCLALAFIICLVACVQKEHRAVLSSLPCLGGGLGVCVLIWMSRGLFSTEFPTEGAYFSTEDSMSVWTSYISIDALRALPGSSVRYTNSFLVMGMSLLLVAGVARLEFKQRERFGPWCWVAVYVGLCGLIVWGCMGIHALTGSQVPYLVISWMPYRFTNHADMLIVVLLTCVLCSTIVRDRDEPKQKVLGYIFLAAALFYGASRPLLPLFIPETIYERYLATGEGLMFFLCAVCAYLLFVQLKGDSRFRGVWAGAGILFCLVALWAHQFGAFCLLVGFISAWLGDTLLRRMDEASLREKKPFLLRGLGIVTVLFLLSVSISGWQGRSSIPVTSFDTALVSYLDSVGDSDAMLVARPDQYMLQSRVSNPVIMDCILPPWIPYMPSVGPSIQKIHKDIFGARFDQIEGDATTSWGVVWESRDELAWRSLADAYQFKYIVSPNTIPLQLPVALAGEEQTLYRVYPVGALDHE